MTKKKVSKKTSKKAVKQKKVLLLDIKPKKILNKKNAIEFAEYIYKEVDFGKISYCKYVKLCHYSLIQNKKKPLSCILGEAYLWFINNTLSVKDLEKEVDNHLIEIENHNNIEDIRYKTSLFDEPEELICYLLAKNSTTNDKRINILQNKLEYLPTINDHVGEETRYSDRAMAIKEYWMNSIVPLLK